MADRWAAIRLPMQQWQAPAELAAAVKAAWATHGEALITGPGTQFWREASNGADFALLLGAEAVRLADCDPPDVELRYRGHIVAVEVVEALQVGRRRGEEYAAEERIKAALRSGDPILPRDRAHARRVGLRTRSEAEQRAARRLRFGMELNEDERRILASLLADTDADDLVWEAPESELTEPDKTKVMCALARAARSKASRRYDPAFWLLIYLNPGFTFLSPDDVHALFAEGTDCAKDAFTEVWVLWNSSTYQAWRDGRRGNIVVHRPAA